MGEDYKLLENMNTITRERYTELAVVAQELMQEVGKLRTTCNGNVPTLTLTLTLQPLLLNVRFTTSIDLTMSMDISILDRGFLSLSLLSHHSFLRF